MVNRYSEFVAEKLFESIISDIFLIVESEGNWTDDNTYEWDIQSDEVVKQNTLSKTKEKLSRLVTLLPKEKIKEYYIRLINKLENFPSRLRRFLIVHYTSVFLAVVSLGYLIGGQNDSDVNTTGSGIKKETLKPKMLKEVDELTKKSKFEIAQQSVKEVEAGFSDDRNDSGNWVRVPGYGRRFVGTNHGIAAPTLAEYLGRIPKREDMENLSYGTALKIFKNNYWDAQNLGEFCNQSVANIIYDGCVNQGIYRMKDLVKIAASEQGVEIEGQTFTPSNIKKINSLNQEKLFNSIKKQREIAYKNSDTWSVHGEGWMNRINNIQFSK